MSDGSPILVVMAAGLGSRYGGLKQLDPVGPNGEILMDYALYDAKQAGFRRVVFLISPGMEQDFMEVIGSRISRHMEVRLAFQTLTDLPGGYRPPAGRTKPWGTAHAVYCCRNAVNGPFAVVNADDYYGKTGFRAVYRHLCNRPAQDMHFAMVGYTLENTLTESGFVSRGICELENGMLKGIVERTHICALENGPAYSTDGGQSFEKVPQDSLASMNLWGFTPRLFAIIEAALPEFLSALDADSGKKAELYLPEAVGRAVRLGNADVKVFESRDRWYGMTYREDREKVVSAMREMHRAGMYPSPLWDAAD